MGDVTVAGEVKGAVDKLKNSGAPLSTLDNVGCDNSATNACPPSGDGGVPSAEKSDVPVVIEAPAVQEDQRKNADAPSPSSLRREDQISNGMGQDLEQALGDSQGGASKLVNNKADCPSSPPAAGSAHVQAEVPAGGEQQERTKLAEPTAPCPDSGASAADVQSGQSGDRTLSEGPPSGSDPDPSLGGESRSLDSLESFSNLNSCPSSEGLDERGLALALQGDYASDGTKTSCAKDRAAGQSIYHIKWIKWREENTPIITQNENGPCPLLAIMNVLLLAWKVKMPPMMEIITAEQLMEYLGDYILETKPKEISEVQRLNYEQVRSALLFLRSVKRYILLILWGFLFKSVGVSDENEAHVCVLTQWSLPPPVTGIVAEQFLSSTATQLTYHGLCELTSTVQEGELCVFFRNNHFSTMIKYKGQLYLLVTDQGFLTEEKVVWESLHNVDGDGNFCDSEFRLRPPSDPETVYRGQQDQIDQDYLMALSLQQEQQSQDLQWEQLPEGISDLELAKKLQEEEDRRASQYYHEQEQEQAAAAQAQAQVGRAGLGDERREELEQMWGLMLGY
uniref:Ubiquitin carboxyl-terminal hydrolase n=1 Tax=Fundulus heteroclitus TaxID=8078 RepID=A0A3Q2QSG6_FUNHE